MAQITAAPYPLMLGGVEYRMSPLRDVDIDELTNWLRSYIIKSTRAAMVGVTDPDERNEFLQAAISMSSSISYGDQQSLRYLKSKDGMLRVFYQGIRRNHPRLAYDAFVASIESEEDIAELMRVWEEINLPQKHSSPPGEGGDSGGETTNKAGPLSSTDEALPGPDDQ